MNGGPSGARDGRGGGDGDRPAAGSARVGVRGGGADPEGSPRLGLGRPSQTRACSPWRFCRCSAQRGRVEQFMSDLSTSAKSRKKNAVKLPTPSPKLVSASTSRRQEPAVPGSQVAGHPWHNSWPQEIESVSSSQPEMVNMVLPELCSICVGWKCYNVILLPVYWASSHT